MGAALGPGTRGSGASGTGDVGLMENSRASWFESHVSPPWTKHRLSSARLEQLMGRAGDGRTKQCNIEPRHRTLELLTSRAPITRTHRPTKQCGQVRRTTPCAHPPGRGGARAAHGRGAPTPRRSQPHPRPRNRSTPHGARALTPRGWRGCGRFPPAPPAPPRRAHHRPPSCKKRRRRPL